MVVMRVALLGSVASYCRAHAPKMAQKIGSTMAQGDKNISNNVRHTMIIIVNCVFTETGWDRNKILEQHVEVRGRICRRGAWINSK